MDIALPGLLLGFALLAGGTTYTAVVGPPSLGHFVDGGGRAQALFMRVGKANLNKQYVWEGLGVSMLVLLGSIGLILLAGPAQRPRSEMRTIIGFLSFAVGFNGVAAMVHQKLPGYLLQSL